jgi:MoaA/NifB/PqqE/SkfB family radical SAM enzyme
MNAKWMIRLFRETDPKVRRRFLLNLGWKGMKAVKRFRRRVKQGEYFPAFLFLSLTNSCNLRCQGCWVTPTCPPQELSLPTLSRIIEAAKRQGATFFGLLGGEPLLHCGLMTLLEEHPDCYFLLFTNGTLITPELARRMKQLGNVSPLISIEGREQVSDTRRGGTGVYERTWRGLRNCVDQGLVTGVATSVCASNFDELVSEPFIRELVDEGVLYLWYYIYRPVGPQPCPELVLDESRIHDLRRFLVKQRGRAPLLLVDSYWDQQGRAFCPAVLGISHHIGPAGDVEPCPPIQFARERLDENSDVCAAICGSEFLDSFRQVVGRTTRGCILMERPDVLRELVVAAGVRDSSGRDTGLAELAAMAACPSHHQPGREIPERSLAYRFAKKYWFFGFGAYG